MNALSVNGMIHLSSPYSVEETVSRLEKLLTERGITVFANIDHAAGAAAVGLQMPASQLLIFGSPKSGTPLMIAAPTAAIDLPLKVLVWEDHEGKVRLSFNSPEYLQQRHDFPEQLLPNIAGARAIFETAVKPIVT